MIAYVALLLLAVTVSACTPVDKGFWWKLGMTEEQGRQDDYQCIRENLVTSYQSERYLGTVTTTPRSAVNEELYDRCMMARGYRIVPKDFVPPR